ncbi:MAG: DoxX family protein [Gammaproteobacteria bacterium]|nr:MAG: DoxX family protein [Gammaproteobacteria bacterium]
MNSLVTAYTTVHRAIFTPLQYLDGIAPLLLRLFLAPVMMAAGWHKFQNFNDMVAWFGNADWGLGLPAPAVMVFLAASAELVGGVALLVGLAVRWFAIPLMISMAVAAATVHWEHGWFAIAPGNPETSTAMVLADIGVPAAKRSLENSTEVGRRVSAAKSILREHGNYSWLTEKGTFVVLNNGIEFAATYFVMLLSLFFTGGGRYFSIDDWLRRIYWKDAS